MKTLTLFPRWITGVPCVIVLLLVCLTTQAQHPFTIVSVGDSVGSGEGAPTVPQEVELNLDYNPVEHLPNPNFNPLPQLPNPDFDPRPVLVNPNYDPRPSLINVNYQPFEIPSFLAALLPNFPPYNPNLLISNPNHDPNLTVSNPNYDLAALIDNTSFDTNLFAAEPNPDYSPELFNILSEVVWEHEPAHRSALAGPALAAAALENTHPDLEIDFTHRAFSGASITGITEQIRVATSDVGGRIDVLMISAGGNNIAGVSFSGLALEILSTVTRGHRPSMDTTLSNQLATGWVTMSNLFDEMALEIDDCNVGEVFITEYYDMLRGSDGQFCFDDPIIGQELQWAYENVILRLNETIAAAAERHGWHYVGGIAEGFRNHGICADRNVDLRPVLLNPDYDPRQNIPNWDYHPIANLPNLNYNPIPALPNLNYNPIQNIPNWNYDPLQNIPNPNFNINPLSPNYDPRLTIPNPDYDPRLVVPNPAYNPNLTVPNPNHDPDLTVPNPNYDNRLVVTNPDYNPNVTIANPDFNPIPLDGENWVVRPEESLLLQGDPNGTGHPNYRGHEFTAQRLVAEISAVGLEKILGCPVIMEPGFAGPALKFQFTSEHPVESLKLQWTPTLSPPFWGDAEGTFRDLGNQLFEFETEEGTDEGYFRVLVE